MRSKKIYLILVMLICLYSSLLSQGVDTRSCMNTFTNQTVSFRMYYTCDTKRDCGK